MILSLVCVYGCAQTGDASQDEFSGKADFSQCEETELLSIINKPEDLLGAQNAGDIEEILTSYSNKTTAARIVQARPFASIDELDAVRGVGPRTLEKLGNLAADYGSTACTGGSSDGQIEVIFSPAPSYDESHLKVALDAIKAAKHSIDFAMYSFSEPSIQAAIIDAHDRGVTVRISLDDTESSSSYSKGVAKSFETAGITVRTFSSSKTMHHKFVIVDGPQDGKRFSANTFLMTGSANWTSSAAYARPNKKAYDENTLVIRGHEELTVSYQNQFNFIWFNGKESTTGFDDRHAQAISADSVDLTSPDLDRVALFSAPGVDLSSLDATSFSDDANAETIYTSDNFYVGYRTGLPYLRLTRDSWKVADRWREEILAARESIHIASGHFGLPQIAGAIEEALANAAADNRNLDVRLYVDQQDAGEPEVAQIKAAGAQIRVKMFMYKWAHPAAQQMHHKYMVIDGERVLSGSYNLSPNAEQATLENVNIFDAAGYESVVDAFQVRFYDMWEHGADARKALKDDIADGGDLRITWFGTFSLPLDDYYATRGDMEQACPQLQALHRDRDLRKCFAKSRFGQSGSQADLVRNFVVCDPSIAWPRNCN